MEFNISDLLDDYQDSHVPIQTQNVASAQRIKELTMKKIEAEKNSRGKGRTIGRMVLIAAIVLAMATTVLAASGFNFSDWINRREGEGFEEDVFYGSGSMFWEIGERMFRVSVTEASPTGAVLEWWNQGENVEGELTADARFWLEQWNGSEYIPMKPLNDSISWPDEIMTIPEGETPMSFALNWEEIYGTLSTGYYRIGKTFTLTLNGETKTVEGYAKFRLFTEEMKPYLEKCRAALNALLEQESYHIRIRQYPGVHNSDMFYDCLYSEIWKSGEDYLRQTKYILETDDGDELKACRGSMSRDGQGYSLEWEADTVTRPVSYCEQAGYVDNADDYYTVWLVGMDWYESIVGEVYAEGNQITLLSHSSSSQYPYDEHVLTFDEAGDLIRLEHYYLPEQYCEAEEKVFYGSVEVLDTASDEVARLIASQDVTTPNAFSWEEERAAYPDAKRDGFVNTAARTIGGVEDVVQLALADSTMTTDMEMYYQNRYYNVTKVFYDEDAKIWKVEFSFTQGDYFQTVYLDENGITKLVVKGTFDE